MTAESMKSLAKKSARMYTQLALDEALVKFNHQQKAAILEIEKLNKLRDSKK